jgi:uncharacterized protein with HEPN domain
MRREELYLRDVVEAADAVERFVDNIGIADFIDDEMRQSAVLQKLMVIGEATARISESFRNRYPEVPWADIIGFRNIAVHEYFVVDWSIVWTTATGDVPILRQQMVSILDKEFDQQD